MRLLAYLWALPTTLVGAVVALVCVAFGARVQWVQGACEVHGGRLGRFVARAPAPFSFSAITLGHVILGVSAAELRRVRRHEHVHVRQAEMWGPFFLPAYVLASLWQWLRGRRMYLDNPFERQAYRAESRPDRKDASL